jgi:hypothetical protein
MDKFYSILGRITKDTKVKIFARIRRGLPEVQPGVGGPFYYNLGVVFVVVHMGLCNHGTAT